MEPVVLEKFEVAFDEREVMRLLGRRGDADTPPGGRFEEAFAGAIARTAELVTPRGIYTITAGRELPGSAMFTELERVAFCICTIGPTLEREVSSLTGSGRLLEGVVLDAAGSVAAEAVAEHIDREIASRAAENGLKTSCRASPGYGDWDIREQECIFRLLPGERIGVRLSESFMMIPRKSVSFAVHIAERPVRMRSENSCRNCSQADCRYRLLE